MSSMVYAAGSQSGSRTKLIGSLRYDRLIALLSLLLLGGLHLDGWAHLHVPELETFFTPWHGALYSGFAAVSAALVLAFLVNHWRGLDWSEAMPAGYGLSLLGVPLFLLGGLGDMTWHILFGIEANTEALLSPTHLLLATSVVLFVTGPFRAALRREAGEGAAQGWAALLPMVLSLSLLLTLLTFFTQYASIWASTSPAAIFAPTTRYAEAGTLLPMITMWSQTIGIAGVLVQTAILMGIVLLAIRRWRLPFGSLTLILTLSMALITAMRTTLLATGMLPLILAAAAAGLIADLLLRLLRPSGERPNAFRWFAFTMPVVLYAAYFAALALTTGIWWSIHLWTGAIVLAGVVGLLLSLLIVPPFAAERNRS